SASLPRGHFRGNECACRGSGDSINGECPAALEPHIAASVQLFLRELRRLTAGEGPSDPELLSRFTRDRDESAFAALVGRHGPMVLAVCRRVLGAPQDAEHAFQATFLVLARRACQLARPDALAGWLHGVALKVAFNARARHRPVSLADTTS